MPSWGAPGPAKSATESSSSCLSRKRVASERGKRAMRRSERGRCPRCVRGRLDALHRAGRVLLGVLTLVLVGVLFLWDASPELFPARAHAVLGALPLALIAVAYLSFQVIRRPTRVDLVKASIVALAFFFWSANQCWPDMSGAT